MSEPAPKPRPSCVPRRSCARAPRALRTYGRALHSVRRAEGLSSDFVRVRKSVRCRCSRVAVLVRYRSLGYLGARMSISERNHAANVERFRRLLRDAQELPLPKEIKRPPWQPPGIEDLITDVELARWQLSAELGREKTKDWNDARIWREMYAREYEISDKLRALAQKLDDAFDEIESYDTDAIDDIAELARRLQLDLGE